jgi:Asp-tRNA(Asn)/Glu-tRNA(Gln) amidotransferase A subunit family amidase
MPPDSSQLRAESDARLDRRTFMTYFASLGLGGTALPTAIWALTQEGRRRITKDMLANAEAVAGLDFTDGEREMMVEGLNRNLDAYEQLRSVSIPNGVHPALLFDPVLPGRTVTVERRAPRRTRRPEVQRPANLEDVAFWSLTDLGELLRSRQVSSVELTRMYLDRLTRHGPRLECVITLTEALAMRQAARADAELAVGTYRGPLHGIPWGAKDLLAEDDYRTTWGAKPFEDQTIPYDATVVQRLEEAGAVLIAKLTLGALAMGDYWFGGQTRNPWNPAQGSSGSSAGSASATVAGLVGFGIGSETLGSIVSPATRCGATGLRPTFGRVSRFGAMALSWSMDKLGPLCRSVEDCALVFAAIHGADGNDPTARTLPFDWDPGIPLHELRIGYYKKAFEEEHRGAEYDLRALEALRGLGVDPIPIELPEQFPVNALRSLLSVEAAAAFDELTRSNRDDLLVRQDPGAWPNSFRRSRLVPAVEYIQANRVRTMLMGAMAATMDGIDVFITPSYGGTVLLTTNLTGHPAVTVPSGFQEDGTPVSISFIGKLFGEAELLAVAKSYQDATGFHLQHPAEFP